MSVIYRRNNGLYTPRWGRVNLSHAQLEDCVFLWGALSAPRNQHLNYIKGTTLIRATGGDDREPAFQMGRYGQEALFDGADDNLQDSTVQQFGTTEPWSAVVWVSPRAASAENRCFGWLSFNPSIKARTDQAWGSYWNGGNRNGTTQLTVGEYYMLAVTYDGNGTYRNYLNGKLEAEHSVTSSTGSSGIAIGQDGSQYLNGVVRQVRIFQSEKEGHELCIMAKRPWDPWERRIFIPFEPVTGGSITVMPTTASAGADSAVTTVIEGSITVTPTVATGSAVATDPAVSEGGDLPVTPAVATARANNITAPSVIKGSLTLTPTVSTGSAVSTDPNVLTPATGIQVTPTVATASAVSTDPSVELGSITLTPAVATGRATSADPAIILGGDLTVMPTVATAAASTTAPTVLDSFTFQPPAAQATASTTAPTVLVSAILVTPTVATARTSAIEITVIGGAFVPRPTWPGVEVDADRDGLFLDSGETLTHNGTDYTVLIIEADGEELDSGTSVDGILEALIRCENIVDGSINEHDPITYNGASYHIDKIDEFGGGISLLYLTNG